MSNKLLTAAQDRIRAAYSPQLTAECSQKLVDAIARHLRSSQASTGQVLPWQLPQANVEEARELLQAAGLNAHEIHGPATSAEIASRFGDLLNIACKNSIHLMNPRYIGHQVGPPLPVAALFECLSALLNQGMAVYEMGPWATGVERALIEELGEMFGLPAGTFAGIATHGGSAANLTALLTARNVALADSWSQGIKCGDQTPVLLAQQDAHYCISRSAGIMGLGTEQVLRVPVDSRRKMNVAALDEMLTDLRRTKRPVIAVVACACSTPIGAFDPLVDIAAVCHKHAVWMHVDAAHGGACVFSESHRHLIQGLELADSFICDAHKMMFVPALCAFTFYKNSAHRFRTFHQDAPYLYDPTSRNLDEYDSGLSTLECTKRALALPLWGVWTLLGRQVFADLVDTTFALAQRFYELLEEAPDFIPLHRPEANILTFQHVPASLKSASPLEIGDFNRNLRRRLIERGDFYIVQTTIDGIGTLRAVVMNPLTSAADLIAVLEEIRHHGHAVDLRPSAVGG